jgi:hypothetical protein
MAPEKPSPRNVAGRFLKNDFLENVGQIRSYLKGTLVPTVSHHEHTEAG